MSLDARKNFAISTVATAPSPANSGTSLVVATGDGAKFPAVPFNAVVWPTGANPTSTNAEIVRVTAKSTDTLTITRAQESSAARSIIVGDQIMQAITNKSLTDIEEYINGTTAPTLLTPSITSPATMSGGEAMLRNTLYYTAGATWTKPSGLKFIIVEVIGGGGGSGGCATTGAGQSSAGGGGGAGGFSRKKIAAGSLGSSETITVGAGGSAGSAGANDGGTGGNTTFGAHLTGSGGVGGTGGTASGANTSASGGAGGAASGGDLNVSGEGGASSRIVGGNIVFFGNGASAAVYSSAAKCAGAAQPAVAGASYGGGAAAGNNAASTAQKAGAAGADGLVIVYEYF